MHLFLLALLLVLGVSGVPPSNSQSPLLKQIHAFYYMWYGTPEVDGSWKHWDHSVLPHWRQEVTAQHPTVGQRHAPDKEHLHSRFFPMGGPYSSSDPEVVGRHMQWLMAAGVDTVVASWWGPAWRSQSTDGQGVTTDAVLPILLRAAHAHGVRVAFHLEPYPGRTAATVREDVEYLVQQHGGSPALLRVDGKPVYYVYDSYHIGHSDWAELLMPSGKHTLRGGPLDGIFIGLWLNIGDGDSHIMRSGFDGFYTYFSSDAASYASHPTNWLALCRWARHNSKLCVPCVGPGYDDEKIRPWNSEATRGRDGGRRYRLAWREALRAGADVVAITSFNEWGEGSQIEPAQGNSGGSAGGGSGGGEGESYAAYVNEGGLEDPWLYLNITAELSRTFKGSLEGALAQGTQQGQQGEESEEEEPWRHEL